MSIGYGASLLTWRVRVGRTLSGGNRRIFISNGAQLGTVSQLGFPEGSGRGNEVRFALWSVRYISAQKSGWTAATTDRRRIVQEDPHRQSWRDCGSRDARLPRDGHSQCGGLFGSGPQGAARALRG